MIFKSGLVTQASGSLGGITFSHNAGGMYMRARAIPTNPNTTFQQTIRGFVSALVDHWGNTLTQVQRDAWILYANNVPLLNSLGEPINVSGLNMYVRSNVPILQGSLPRADAAPTDFNLGEYTNPSFALDEPNDEIDVTFVDTDAWANEDDSAMLIFTSRAQSPTINYFKGPYRLAGAILGDGITPPTSPAVLGLPFVVAPGQRIFARAEVVRADGRLSADFLGQADA
jgi:hypothetical protein